MIHLPELIQDLALILVAAGVVTLLFKRLRQPVVLGYIVAGFLVGPHFSLIPTIGDLPNIRVWAEIGVIVLLFALGLEFSFKKLTRVGGAASVTTLVEVAGMITIGFLSGRLFGWNNMDSLFLGGVLAISSTTIIIRAFDELGVKTRGFVSLVFGVLIVEDLVAILLMVLLSTMAVSQSFSGVEMASATLKLGFFMVLWFVSGIFLIPSFLRASRRFFNDETLLVVALGLCFAMVVAATYAGFSPALGAFVMGSLLAETSEGHKIERLIHPVKDLFAAIFFVSVGMLLEPPVLMKYAGPIVAITLITIVGKALTSAAGALLSGQSLRHSVQAGMSLAQIGEFSFIIASLGLSLKVTSDFLYPVAVGVSALTTFTTPYLIKSSDPVVSFLERRLPEGWRNGLNRYAVTVRGLSATGEWSVHLQAYTIRMVTNAVLITAIVLGAGRYLGPLLAPHGIDGGWVLVLALLLSTPFVWAMVFSRIAKPETLELGRIRHNRLPLFILEALRWVLAISLISFLSAKYLALRTSVIVAIALMLIFLLSFSRYVGRIYAWFERRFVENLSEKDESENRSRDIPLAPWDAHLVKLPLSADSKLIGQTLGEAKIRERFGVTVASIERGSRSIYAPGQNERLFPHDSLAVIGEDNQIQALRFALDDQIAIPSEIVNYSLQGLAVDENSSYREKSIRESGIRESLNGLVVGVERDGQRILNPDSSLTLKPGDLVWIVCETEKARLARETNKA